MFIYLAIYSNTNISSYLFISTFTYLYIYAFVSDCECVCVCQFLSHHLKRYSPLLFLLNITQLFYRFILPNGVPFDLSYTAGVEGFQPVSSHIPQPVPSPFHRPIVTAQGVKGEGASPAPSQPTTQGANPAPSQTSPTTTYGVPA